MESTTLNTGAPQLADALFEFSRAAARRQEFHDPSRGYMLNERLAVLDGRRLRPGEFETAYAGDLADAKAALSNAYCKVDRRLNRLSREIVDRLDDLEHRSWRTQVRRYCLEYLTVDWSQLATADVLTDIEKFAKDMLAVASEMSVVNVRDPGFQPAEVRSESLKNRSDETVAQGLPERDTQVVGHSCDLVAQTKSGSVLLYGPGSRPIVNGNEKETLTNAQYDVVLAVLESGDRGLTKDELDRKSRHGDARRILKRVANGDPDWEKVISFAGTPGKGYRIE